MADNIFYTKKAKAEMRARRRRKLKAAPDGGDGDGDGGRLDRGEDDDRHTAENTQSGRKRAAVQMFGSHQRRGDDDRPSVVNQRAKKGHGEQRPEKIAVPANLTSKEAKKFRKEARRKARAQGRPDDNIEFVVDGAKGAPGPLSTAAGGRDDDGGHRAKRKGADKSRFPRINDLLSEHAARARLDERLARRKEEDDAVPPDEKGRYVAVDCEMVGVGADGRRSALARASAVDWDGRVLLDAFVRVPERVTDFRTRVSGVRPRDIGRGNEDAIDHGEVQRAVSGLLAGRVLVGHALENDLRALMLSHPRDDMRDTARYRPFMRASGRDGGRPRPRKLRDLVHEHLGRRIQVEGEAHCSVDDARASMDLFKCVRGRWEKELAAKKEGGGSRGRK